MKGKIIIELNNIHENEDGVGCECKTSLHMVTTRAAATLLADVVLKIAENSKSPLQFLSTFFEALDERID